MAIVRSSLSSIFLAILVASAMAASAITPPVDVWASDPAVEMRDAYKWIFQATMGGEHAAPSRDAADRWLRQEWEGLGPTAPDERLLEPLGDSGIVRLHLRPFRDAGGAPDALLEAFLASAASFIPAREVFERAWRALGARLQQAPIGRLTHEDWVQLDDETRKAGYPAAHHSERYTQAHQPAYRVLTAERAASLAKSLPERPAGPR